MNDQVEPPPTRAFSAVGRELYGLPRHARPTRAELDMSLARTMDAMVRVDHEPGHHADRAFADATDRHRRVFQSASWPTRVAHVVRFVVRMATGRSLV